MTENTLVKFQDTEIQIYRYENNKWINIKQLARALGYSDSRQLARLISRNSDEFIGKTFVVKLTTNAGAPEMIINYHGVIRAAMLSKTDKAKSFRDWAEEVLFVVMTQGHIDIRNPLLLTQETCHKDINLLWSIIDRDPQSSIWVYPRMQYVWDKYTANYDDTPRIGITTLTEEWFKKLYLEQKWSRDAIILYFPLQLINTSDFERYRKQWNVPLHKTPPMDPTIAKHIYRDSHQYHMRLDSILRNYPQYSRESIYKHLRKTEAGIISILAANQVYNVERFNEKSYADYRKTREWDNKKKALIAPTGPFDNCWDCSRPISLSTVHLHHMLYDRVGYELWTDFRPLCSECHAYRHSDKIINKTNRNQTPVVLSNVTIIEERELALQFTTEDGQKHWTPKSCVFPQSEATKVGEKGNIVVTYSIAKQKGLV